MFVSCVPDSRGYSGTVAGVLSSYEEGDTYGRPPMPPPQAEMWPYRPPFDMPFDARWGRGMPPPFMPPPPDFRIPVSVVRIDNFL